MQIIDIETPDKTFELTIRFNRENCVSDIVQNNVPLIAKERYVVLILQRLFELVTNGLSYDVEVFIDLDKQLDSLLHRSFFRVGLDYKKMKEDNVNGIKRDPMEYVLPIGEED